MSTAIVTTNPTSITTIPQQAASDEQLIGLWLHGKSETSQRAYTRDIDQFRQFINYNPLQVVTLQDVQDYLSCMADVAVNTQKRYINSVKSLFSFASKIGYVQFNVGAAIKAPKAKNTLAERILSEDEVLKMIHCTDKQRDKVLLRILYASAGRVSEICRLCWRDVQPNGDSGQVVLFGKGNETRVVKLSKATYKELTGLRNGAAHDAPVFVSQKGGAVTDRHVRRIVKSAAECCGIEGNVSPHWFRHSHASHALDRGANVALVRDTLGHSSLAVTSRYVHAKPDDSSAMHLAV